MVTFLTIRCKLHETCDGEDDIPRQSTEISIDDDTPPDLIHTRDHGQHVSMKSNADQESYQHRVSEPIRNDVGYVPDLIHSDRKHLFLKLTGTSREPAMVDERQLREYRVGSDVEGPEQKHDADIDEEENVSSPARLLVSYYMPEGTKAEPEKRKDNAIACSGDERAGEPCLFCKELGR